jgi:hypothetical protein
MKYFGLLSFIVLVVVGTCAQQGRTEPLPYGTGVIADYKGEITLRSQAGAALEPQKGLVLPADSIIETGKGSLLLSLADGSQVLIKPHTRVQLKAPATSKGNFLQLFLGNIIAKVQKRFGVEPSFRMGTPTAVITVRGTRFSVEVTKKNKTVVEVYEGLVEVVGLGAPARPMLIRPGFSTQVGQEGTPETPRSMQGPEGSDGKETDQLRPRGQGVGSDGEGSAPGTSSPVQRPGSSGESPD